MNYSMIHSIQSAKEFLYSFVNYERKMPIKYNTNYFDMMQFSRFLHVLGNPHLNYPVIHIAGTKGKGSTAVMIASALRHAGYRTGLYLSPHVRDTRERIQVDGAWIPEESFIDLCDRLERYVKEFSGFDQSYRTTFELLTAMGFLYFKHSGVDAAVIETGLGGRLDSTNVVSPILTVITRIGKDHTHLLGDTLASIAREKAGIFKDRVPVVLSRQHYRARTALLREAAEKHAPVHEASRGHTFHVTGRTLEGTRLTVQSGPFAGSYYLRAPGLFQLENLQTVLSALEILRGPFPGITAQHLGDALSSLDIPGRFQVLHKSGMPLIILDAAHNADSMRQLVRSIRTLTRHPVNACILALSREKKCRAIGKILAPHFHFVILSPTSTPRNLTPEEMKPHLAGLFKNLRCANSPENALAAALEILSPDDLLCVTGSFYLIGDMLRILDPLP